MLIGAGQFTYRGEPGASPSPVALLKIAADRAAADAGIGAAGLAAIDALAVAGFTVDAPGGRRVVPHSSNPPLSLARQLGAAPGWSVYSHMGGNTPQQLVNVIAERIARGETDMALAVGCEFLGSAMKRLTKGLGFDDWNEVIRVDLGGCFNMAKATFGGMKSRGWGRIVNIGSVNGQMGQYGQVNYAAAKSGIHGFTKALAQEGAKFGVTVNAIAPGYIDTDMVAAVPQSVMDKILTRIPVGRLGQSAEIARGVVFLCSEEAGFVTGSTMSINGGQHMY